MRWWRLVLAAVLVLAGTIAVFFSAPPAIAAGLTTLSGDNCDFDDLEAAIGAAVDGDVITFDCPANTVINFENEVLISRVLTIDGSNGSDGPIIFDGGDQTRFFNVTSSGDLTLLGLRLQHGKYEGSGGAIFNDGTLTILQSSFAENQGTLGGAIFNDGTLTILQSSFAENQGTLGGVIFNDGTLTVLQSSFVNNRAEGAGGAIFLTKGASQITSTTFSGNTASSYGSTIFISTGTAQTAISWSTIVQPDSTSPALKVDGSLAVEGVIVAGCVDVDTGALIPNYLVIDGTWCAGMSSTPGIVGDVATMEVNGVTQTYYPLPDGSTEIDAAGEDCREPGGTEEPELDLTRSFGEVIWALREQSDFDELDQLGTIRPQAGENAACDIGAVEMTSNVAPVINVITPVDPPLYEGETVKISVDISDADSGDSFNISPLCKFNGVLDSPGHLGNASEFTLPCLPTDQGELALSVVVLDGTAVSETFRFFQVLNADPVFTSNLSTTPRQALTGQLVTLDAEATDVPADPLIYTYSCGAGTLVGTNQCRFDQVGDYQVSVEVDDGDGGQISDSLTVSVFDAASLCANAWTGQLRMGDDCGRSETLIALPLEDFGSISLCVNRWNGAARLGADCGRSEHVVTTSGQDTLSVCVNRWNGVLRVSENCSRSERQDWL